MNLTEIVKDAKVPNYILADIDGWEIRKEDKGILVLEPKFGSIVPCIGQPFLLVNEKRKQKTTLVFRGTPEWNNLGLDVIYNQ